MNKRISILMILMLLITCVSVEAKDYYSYDEGLGVIQIHIDETWFERASSYFTPTEQSIFVSGEQKTGSKITLKFEYALGYNPTSTNEVLYNYIITWDGKEKKGTARTSVKSSKATATISFTPTQAGKYKIQTTLIATKDGKIVRTIKTEQKSFDVKGAIIASSTITASKITPASTEKVLNLDWGKLIQTRNLEGGVIKYCSICKEGYTLPGGLSQCWDKTKYLICTKMPEYGYCFDGDICNKQEKSRCVSPNKFYSSEDMDSCIAEENKAEQTAQTIIECKVDSDCKSKVTTGKIPICEKAITLYGVSYICMGKDKEVVATSYYITNNKCIKGNGEDGFSSYAECVASMNSVNKATSETSTSQEETSWYYYGSNSCKQDVGDYGFATQSECLVSLKDESTASKATTSSTATQTQETSTETTAQLDIIEWLKANPLAIFLGFVILAIVIVLWSKQNQQSIINQGMKSLKK